MRHQQLSKIILYHSAVSEADEQPPEQHSMEKVEEQPLEIPEHSEQNSEDVLASDNEVA